MAFSKTGSPQPFQVNADLCEICNINKASISVNGKMICSDCNSKQQPETV